MTALWHVGRAERKAITVIVNAGRGQALMERLSSEPGVLFVSHHHARGVGSRRVQPGSLVFDEKDVVVMLVEGDFAEAVFALVYRESGVGERHVGLMFMERVLRGHPMMPFTWADEGGE